MKLGHNKFVIIWIALLFILVTVGLASRYLLKETDSNPSQINSFAECVDAGNPIAESYPEQCFADGKSFFNPSQSVDKSGQWLPD